MKPLQLQFKKNQKKKYLQMKSCSKSIWNLQLMQMEVRYSEKVYLLDMMTLKVWYQEVYKKCSCGSNLIRLQHFLSMKKKLKI